MELGRFDPQIIEATKLPPDDFIPMDPPNSEAPVSQAPSKNGSHHVQRSIDKPGLNMVKPEK